MVLIGTIENYRGRTGHYPERVLVDQIYRNRANRAYCKEHGIRISGQALAGANSCLPMKRNRHMQIIPTASKSKEDSVSQSAVTDWD